MRRVSLSDRDLKEIFKLIPSSSTRHRCVEQYSSSHLSNELSQTRLGMYLQDDEIYVVGSRTWALEGQNNRNFRLLSFLALISILLEDIQIIIHWGYVRKNWS